MGDLINADLVKWVDGKTTTFEQHEPEDSAANFAGGGSFIGCIGRVSSDAFRADRAGGCTPTPAGGNRAPCGSACERNSGFACAKEDYRYAARIRVMVWWHVQRPQDGEWSTVQHE